MRSLFGELRERILGKGVKIVFPEGNDDRVVRAAARLKFEGLVDPIILGDPAEVHKILSDFGFADFNYTIINPEAYEGFEEMKEKFVEIRKGKATIEDAEKLLRDVNYFGVMLVKLGLADGMVSGASHSTADTVRPALQIIKTKPGNKIVSSCFILVRPAATGDNEVLAMGDCAINIKPSEDDLVEIALETAQCAKIFGIDPKIAFLSYSTLGSGKGEDVDKMRKRLCKSKRSCSGSFYRW